MKKYVKPIIQEELIEVEDICLVSGGVGEIGQAPEWNFGDLWGN